MKKIILLISVFLNLFGISYANEVNIFSARHYDSDVQLYEKFTQKTGIAVNVVSGKAEALQKRIIEEGKDCVADLYITADVEGVLNQKTLSIEEGASLKIKTETHK